MRPLDRRIVRTRRMLRDALMALIAERGFDSISVQDITERADLRRATFYLHYKSKEELLLATLAELFEGVRQQLEALPPQPALGGKTNLEMFRVIYRHIADYRALYRAILEGQGSAQFSRYIRTYLAGHIQLDDLPTPGLPPEVLANYVAGAELALVTWWLESDMPYTPEHMAELTQRLTLGCIVGAVDPTVLRNIVSSPPA